MLSVQECKKLLKKFDLPDEQVEEIRDSLYQVATILVNGYLTKDVKNGTNTNRISAVDLEKKVI